MQVGGSIARSGRPGKHPRRAPPSRLPARTYARSVDGHDRVGSRGAHHRRWGRHHAVVEVRRSARRAAGVPPGRSGTRRARFASAPRRWRARRPDTVPRGGPPGRRRRAVGQPLSAAAQWARCPPAGAERTTRQVGLPPAAPGRPGEGSSRATSVNAAGWTPPRRAAVLDVPNARPQVVRSTAIGVRLEPWPGASTRRGDYHHRSASARRGQSSPRTARGRGLANRHGAGGPSRARGSGLRPVVLTPGHAVTIPDRPAPQSRGSPPVHRRSSSTAPSAHPGRPPTARPSRFAARLTPSTPTAPASANVSRYRRSSRPRGDESTSPPPPQGTVASDAPAVPLRQRRRPADPVGHLAWTALGELRPTARRAFFAARARGAPSVQGLRPRGPSSPATRIARRRPGTTASSPSSWPVPRPARRDRLHMPSPRSHAALRASSRRTSTRPNPPSREPEDLAAPRAAPSRPHDLAGRCCDVGGLPALLASIARRCPSPSARRRRSVTSPGGSRARPGVSVGSS